MSQQELSSGCPDFQDSLQISTILKELFKCVCLMFQEFTKLKKYIEAIM